MRACTCIEISTWVFELIEKRKRNLRRGVHTHTRWVEEVHRVNFSRRKERGGGQEWKWKKRMACFEELTKKEELERKDKIGR